MKRILTMIAASAIALSATAQGPADALLYTTNTYVGTARTLAMGNAFVALGGDIGAISVNPASSAIYRHSEVSISPAVLNAGSSSAVEGNVSNESFTKFKFNGAGFVLAFDTYRTKGLVNFCFGLGTNRIADFNKTSSGSWRSSTCSMAAQIANDLTAQGVEEDRLVWTDQHNPYSSTNLPWTSILAYQAFLVSPYPVGSTNTYIGATENDSGTKKYIGGPLESYYFTKSSGGIIENAINAGVNISDILYLGANLNLHTLDYVLNTYYSEKALDPNLFDDGFVSMSNDYYLRTTGTGINFEIGAIVTPIAGLRLGATFTTPTLYKLSDFWNYNMRTSFKNGNNPCRYTPDGRNDYRVISPVRWSVGAAYTVAEIGLISVDWESIDYSKLSMANYSGNKMDYKEENLRISKGFQTSSNLRAGVEIRPIARLSLRGGYDWYTTPGNLVDTDGNLSYTYPDTHYVSCGLGYRLGANRSFSIDFAYQRMLKTKEWYTAYAGAPQVSALNYLNRFALTFAYRF